MNAIYIRPQLKRKIIISRVMFWLGLAGWFIFYALRESMRTDARLEIFEALIIWNLINGLFFQSAKQDYKDERDHQILMRIKEKEKEEEEAAEASRQAAREEQRIKKSEKPPLRTLLDYERGAVSIADLLRGLALDSSVGICAAVTKIEVRDSRAGLGGSSTKTHRLERIDGQYLGESQFRIADRDNPEPFSARSPLMISEDGVSRFLEMLGQCPITPGAYTPYWEHTDDYPGISITLSVSRSTVTILTASQISPDTPAWRKPWQVEIDGIKWTVPTVCPSLALQLLTPTLNPEIYAWLCAKANEAPRTEPY